MKNMPVAGQANQTSSLLARAHREMKTGGKIKAENILEHKEGKHVTTAVVGDLACLHGVS